MIKNSNNYEDKITFLSHLNINFWVKKPKSIKFVKLIIAVEEMSKNIKDNKEKNKLIWENSIKELLKIKTNAVRNWQIYRSLLDNLNLSSINPTIDSGKHIKAIKLPVIDKKKILTETNAMPPPLGVSLTWELREFGLSISQLFKLGINL